MLSSVKPLPVGANVLVQQEKAEDVTKGGIVLPDQAKQSPGRGIVLAVGKSVEEVEVGDVVLYNKYNVTGVQVEDNDWVVISEENILLRISDKCE